MYEIGRAPLITGLKNNIDLTSTVAAPRWENRAGYRTGWTKKTLNTLKRLTDLRSVKSKLKSTKRVGSPLSTNDSSTVCFQKKIKRFVDCLKKLQIHVQSNWLIAEVFHMIHRCCWSLVPTQCTTSVLREDQTSSRWFKFNLDWASNETMEYFVTHFTPNDSAGPSHCCEVHGSSTARLRYWSFLPFMGYNLWTTRGGRGHLFLLSFHQQWRLKLLPLWHLTFDKRKPRIKDVLVGLWSTASAAFCQKAVVTFHIWDER